VAIFVQIDSTSWRSPNYDRHNDGAPVLIMPAGLLLHSSEGTQASDLPRLCSSRSLVSSTYYISRAGQIFQLVADNHRAWHAGVSSYDGLTDWNLAIGIELEHKAGQGAYPPAQLVALEQLCRAKIAQYGIPAQRIAAHRWVAQPPGRKLDPSDWSDLDLRRWIARLYQPQIRRYIATTACPIFESREHPDTIALGGKAVMQPGDVFEVDQDAGGWLHFANGVGFLPRGAAKEQS
jgi:N-acetyl-anhydromuramyl-L-alanine amidase AmpD